jgi:hypothetical protein
MTPAERDAAVALAREIRDGLKQYGDRGLREQMELLSGAVLALAERPTCATCRHWQDVLGAHETTAARALCLSDGPTAQHVTRRDWHCADHQLAPREGSTP